MLVLQEMHPEEPGWILGHSSLAANNVTIQKTESTESILEKRNKQRFLEKRNKQCFLEKRNKQRFLDTTDSRNSGYQRFSYKWDTRCARETTVLVSIVHNDFLKWLVVQHIIVQRKCHLWCQTKWQSACLTVASKNYLMSNEVTDSLLDVTSNNFRVTKKKSSLGRQS